MPAKRRDRHRVNANQMFQLLERTGLDDDPKAAMLVGAAAVHPSPDVAQRIQQLISLKAAKHYQYPFSESERSELLDRVDEQITLGTTFTGSTYTLDVETLLEHLLLVGGTGEGKTNAIRHIWHNLSAPVWFLDLKTDYRHLRNQNDDLLVVPWQELRLNPLQPPEQVTPRSWAQTFDTLYGESFGLYAGSMNYLMDPLVVIYEENGIDVDDTYSAEEVRTLPWPTMPQLQTFLRDKGKTGAARSQLRNRSIDRFTSIFRATGDLFKTTHGYPLHRLLQQDVVFELQGLAPRYQDFIIEFLLTWVFWLRQAGQERDSGVKHAFVMDEGKRAFSTFKETDQNKGIPQIDRLTAQMREFGEPLIVADQMPNMLTDALHTNTGTTVMFRLEEGTQFEQVATSMRLSKRQRVFADRLDTGQAIVKSGKRDAAPVQFPYVDIEKSVTDEELEEDLRSEWERLSASKTRGADKAQRTETGEESGDSADTGLSDRARALLDDVAANPDRNLTAHYDALDLSRYSGNKAKEELVRRDLVKPVEIRKKYGQPTILGLTEQGRSYLRQCGVTVEREGRGGTRHCYWQQFLAGLFGDVGVEAVIECDDADIAVEMGGQRVAVEVAMEPANREVQHVGDRLDDGFDRVVIGCRNERVRADLVRKLQAAGYAADDRVQVLVLRRLQSKVEDMM